MSTMSVEELIPHYYICPVCGQAVDLRELSHVRHHESDPDHKPIPLNA